MARGIARESRSDNATLNLLESTSHCDNIHLRGENYGSACIMHWSRVITRESSLSDNYENSYHSSQMCFRSLVVCPLECQVAGTTLISL